MITRPNRLVDWDLDLIKGLLSQGYDEATWFDFKSTISESGAERLRSVIASFANNEGGFLIFGITNDKKLSGKKRLIGIRKEEEYPLLLGNLLDKNIIPRPDFEFRNPPLALNQSKVIPICYVRESLSKPISVTVDHEKFSFPIRSAKGGTSYMPYEDIKRNFVGYAFMLDKLVLLGEELKRISNELQYFGNGSVIASVGHAIEIDTISSCLFSAHGLLQRKPSIPNKLNSFKTTISLINADVRSNLSLMSAINYYGKQAVLDANSKLRRSAIDLRQEINNFLPEYEKFLGDL